MLYNNLKSNVDLTKEARQIVLDSYNGIGEAGAHLGNSLCQLYLKYNKAGQIDIPNADEISTLGILLSAMYYTNLRHGYSCLECEELHLFYNAKARDAMLSVSCEDHEHVTVSIW